MLENSIDDDLVASESSDVSCIECKSRERLDPLLQNDFGICVCVSCKCSNENYEFITKGDIKRKYLLPESHIRCLAYTQRPNPKNVNFAPLKLYLLKHVREMSYKLHEGPEGLQLARKKQQMKQYIHSAERVKSVMSKGSNKKKKKINEFQSNEKTSNYEPVAIQDHKHTYLERFSSEDNCWYKECDCGIVVSFDKL